MSASDETESLGERQDIPCTSMDRDWGDSAPNLLMHPPCLCPRCKPDAPVESDDVGFLTVPGQKQRFRVEPALLGETGRATLG